MRSFHPPRHALHIAIAATVATVAAEGAGTPQWEDVDATWKVPKPRRLKGAPAATAGMGAENLEVSFVAGGTGYRLRLWRNRALLPASSRHVLQFRDGSTHEGPAPEPCFYQGDVVGDAGGSAGISTCGGRLAGVVLAHGGAVAIEPLEVDRHLPAPALGLEASTGRLRHRTWALSDAELLDMQADVARFVHGPANASVESRRLTSPSTKYVEALVVNDYSRVTAFGGRPNLATLATHSASVMNAVTAIYRRAPTNGGSFPYTVQVVLIGQHTLVDSDPWEQTVKKIGSETDCSSLLDLFNSWGQQQEAAGRLVGHDNRVLLSGRDFDGNTVGLAGVSAMCDVSRSGNVNMCGTDSASMASCAAVVAHEMGHNFGMHHDSSGNACPQSGLIMEAVGGGDASDTFSECSAQYITTYFNDVYQDLGACLENLPRQVYGDPICGNGLVERDEDCDCGAADCSGTDACCNGAACKFMQPSYQCSALAGTCCESCMFVSKAAGKVCRAKKGTCDIAEQCQGDSADCPRDEYVYPGLNCTLNGGIAGLCSMGKCSSLEHTCKVEVTRDFQGSWDYTEKCGSYNDDCQQLVCHDAAYSEDYECGQNFATHGKHMMVPDGTPCWYPGDQLGQRNGMCHLGTCALPHSLAAVPLCGNGGIDFGEECDCGTGNDPCCDCATCLLQPSSQCSGLEPCCDASTCGFQAQGAVCRAAAGECDLPEVCPGNSGVCPADVGKQWGTACTAADGVSSTCYGKTCMESLDKQCRDKDSNRPYGDRTVQGQVSTGHECTALMCCSSCTQESGNWIINGQPATDPLLCERCLKSTSWTSFTVNGVTNTIYLGGPHDGTVLANQSTICVGNVPVTPESSCGAGHFLVVSVGRCLPCDSACSQCTGPTNFDCVGACAYGQRDSRGACAISADQLSFANTTSTTPVPSTSLGPSTTPGASTTPGPGQSTSAEASNTPVQSTTPGASTTPGPGQSTSPGPSTSPEASTTVQSTSPGASTTPGPGQSTSLGASTTPGPSSSARETSPTTSLSATAAQPTAAPTTTAAPWAVTLSMVIRGVSYDLLAADNVLWRAFELGVRTASASEAGVSVSYVECTLSAGSVAATVVVTPPTELQGLTARSRLQSSSSLASTVVNRVAAVQGIEAATVGTIEVASMSLAPGNVMTSGGLPATAPGVAGLAAALWVGLAALPALPAGRAP